MPWLRFSIDELEPNTWHEHVSFSASGHKPLESS